MKRISWIATAALVAGLFVPVNAVHAEPSRIFGTTGDAPRLMVFDQAGNLYVANYVSNNVSKITPAGVSTILGTTGTNPRGIAIDSSGNIYTANAGSANVSKITPSGVSTIFATTGTTPLTLVFDQAGNLYTANKDSNNVSKITPSGVSTILGTTGTSPYGIAVDSSGNIYTTNAGSANVSKITPAGVSTILGTTGTAPSGIAVDSLGNVYAANVLSDNVSKITPAGVSTILGSTGVFPWAIAVDSAGNIYTSNSNSNNVTKMTPAGVSTILGTTGHAPTGIAVDPSGNVYTANRDDNTVSKITVAPLPSNGTYSCATGLRSSVGSTYTITDGVVSAGYSCSGNAVIAVGAVAIGDEAFGSAGELHSNVTSITIPDTVTSIGDYSFSGAPLASITIPNSVTNIGVRAFSDTALTSITIPSSVTSMGQRVFVNARSLTSVVIQNGITELPDYLFSGCEHLTSFVIPNSVTTLGFAPFEGSGITSLTVPSSVETVNASFRDSPFLVSVTIPSSVIRIHREAFYNLPNLRSINVDAGNPNFKSVDGVLFNKAGTQLIQYPAGKVGTTYAIPDGVTSISLPYTFDSSLLTAITIPNGVTELGDGVFNPLSSTLLSYEYCEISLTSSNFLSAGLGGKTKTCSSTRVSAGTEPNSKVATIPSGATAVSMTATGALPGTKLNFGGTVPSTVTVVPVAENPGTPTTTPFVISGSLKIVDIKISGTFNGSATVCLDGSENDHLYHYTGGEWVELPSRTYSQGQVCGVTTSFSPFAAAAAATVPSAPNSVTAVSTGPTTAEVSFDAPDSDGGTVITAYTATSSPGGITRTISQASGGTISVSGLITGVAYTFTVKATNYIGNSVASSNSNSITGVVPTTTTIAPTPTTVAPTPTTVAPTPTTVAPTPTTTSVTTTTVVMKSSAPNVSLSKLITAKSIAAYLRLAVSSTSRLSLKVSAVSAKYCTVSGTNLKALKVGSCKLTVTVIPKKGKSVFKSVTLTTTK